MNKKIATYLFDDEVLYAFEPTKEYVAIESQSAEELATSDLKSSSASTPEVQPKSVENEQEVVSREEIVFPMKTHHLFVFNTMSTEEKDFLLKVVQALGLSFTKIDLLDINQNPLVDFKETIYDNTIRTIIFFGENSGKDFLPKLGLVPYQPKVIKSITFVMADKLSQVSKNSNNEKRQLWESLKMIFQN